MHGQITFFLLAGVLILSSMLMISRKRTISSVICFKLALLAAAGIFFQLRAPLLAVSQLLALALVLFATILSAVDIGRLHVALIREPRPVQKITGLVVAIALLLQIAVTIAQHYLLPGERLTSLLPHTPLPWPLSLGELAKAFFHEDLLPLATVLCLLLIGITGITALFQRRT
jgi:NADH:ubiquinone oxidoreductase subunit 6 (subunit J)